MHMVTIRTTDDFNLEENAYKLTKGGHERVHFKLKDRADLLKLSEYFTQVVTQENCPDTIKNSLMRIGFLGGVGSGKSTFSNSYFNKDTGFTKTDSNAYNQIAGNSDLFNYICRVDMKESHRIMAYDFCSKRVTHHGLEIIEHVNLDWRSSELYLDKFEAVHALIGVQRSVELNQFNEEIKETSSFEVEMLCGSELAATEGWKQFKKDTKAFRI